MAVLYLTQVNAFDDKNSGVGKKIQAQIKALVNMGKRVYLAYVKNDSLYVYDYNLITETEICGNFKNLIDKRLKIFSSILTFIEKNKIEVLYVRNMYACPIAVRFFRNVKKLDVKIILEIPTYPYDGEITNIRDRITLFVDKIFRRYYRGNIDNIVTFSEDKYIYGIPCINISNGIDKDEIRLMPIQRPNHNINMLSVSGIYPWHGLDRIVEAMARYYAMKPNKIVKLYIVGPKNNTLDSIMLFVETEGLSQYVEYLGFLTGKKLEYVYDQSNLGVGSLARHRNAIYHLKSLKNREYCAKGLPFFYSEYDSDFDNLPFTYKVTADDSLININDLIEWYEKIDINNNIYEYAYNFTWEKQMGKIFKK